MVNFGLEKVRFLAAPLVAENYDFYYRMHVLAAYIYRQINSEAAKSAPRKVPPVVYHKNPEKNYSIMVQTYLKSGVEPDDVSI